jgi:hypothetical protein
MLHAMHPGITLTDDFRFDGNEAEGKAEDYLTYQCTIHVIPIN